MPEDDDELFLWNGWPTKEVEPYLNTRILSGILLTRILEKKRYLVDH